MEAEEESPSKSKGGQARRPMNAFLIFCKRHRSLVREKNPHLDNRSVTRILGELWAKLSLEEKASYTSLANEYKEAFMKANPDYKWFNTDKSHPVRDGKPSTRTTNSLVAYHGEIPRSESHETSTGQYQHLAPPTSGYSRNFKPPHPGVSQPVTLSRTSVPTVQQQGQGIIDFSGKVPTSASVDGQQVSMAVELMKCVTQANNYSRLSQEPDAPVSMVTTHGNTAVKDTKVANKEYGNVSLLHLAKMCSDELESSKQAGKTDVQSSMLTPPWTPQYDKSYSPPRVETATGETQPVKENKDKENLPNNMQNGKMTSKEFKQRQNGSATKAEHFKNLILSTDSDVTTCGKLVVDRVIESIYSQEFGKIEPKPELTKVDSRPKTTTVSSTYTPQQNQNGTKPGEKLSSLFNGQGQQQYQGAVTAKNELAPDVKEGGKVTLTFGQIQETLIRKAVENSYDFDIASGLKSENIAYLHDTKDKTKKEKKADYSVFDFPSLDVGQNLVEMSSFESRIKSKKFDSSKGAFSTGNYGMVLNQPKPSYTQTSTGGPFTQVATSANRLTASNHTNSSGQVISYSGALPAQSSGQYMNRTAMELLQKCDELSKSSDHNRAKQNGQSAKVTDWRPSGSISMTSPVAAQKSPPVPLKKRKFHLPIEPNPVEEKPIVVVDKSRERTISVESLNQDENSRDSNDSTETRKSKRSNRGQRYKALMKQGVLQGSREKSRKNSNGSETSTPSTEESPTPPNILPVSSVEPIQVPPVETAAPPVNNGQVIVPRPIRKRTYSEVNTTFTTPSRVRRYTTGDFDLEAHIASLPVVDIDGVGRKGVSRPKPKPKIRHHSESSVLTSQATSHCAPISLISSMTARCSGAASNTDKMINVAELRKVIRQRSSSGGSDLGRERSNSTGSQSGSAAKRKARKRAITHLIPVSTPHTVSGAGVASDCKKKADVAVSVSTSSSSTVYNLPASTCASSDGQSRRVLTCP